MYFRYRTDGHRIAECLYALVAKPTKINVAAVVPILEEELEPAEAATYESGKE